MERGDFKTLKDFSSLVNAITYDLMFWWTDNSSSLFQQADRLSVCTYKRYKTFRRIKKNY